MYRVAENTGFNVFVCVLYMQTIIFKFWFYFDYTVKFQYNKKKIAPLKMCDIFLQYLLDMLKPHAASQASAKGNSNWERATARHWKPHAIMIKLLI